MIFSLYYVKLMVPTYIKELIFVLQLGFNIVFDIYEMFQNISKSQLNNCII